jgi:hypothetical protein
VLRNRAKKNENKGKHHRQMADKKMAKGMFWFAPAFLRPL